MPATNIASLPAALAIRGIRLLNLATDEALAAIEVAVAAGKSTSVAFVNADCVNIAAGDPAYRDDLAKIDWVFIDGVGMRIAGRILGQPVRDNVNGTDLFPLLCESLARRRKSLFLLGARPGVAAAAADWVRREHPGVTVAGSHHGYFSDADEATVLARIRASRPDVLLVALGAPRQEAWITRNLSASGATVAIGVGGLFDYYSGRIPRAPLWLRRLGLEWIYRLLQEPGRLWRRYLLGNAVFVGRIAVDRIFPRRALRPGP